MRSATHDPRRYASSARLGSAKPRAMSGAAPTTLQLDLFRAVEDVHEMTGAIVVLLVDEDGTALAISGDEQDLPPSLRKVLSARGLREAGSARELLTPIAGELSDSRLNVTVLDVAGRLVLAIAFDAEADLETVLSVGEEARGLIAELLAAELPS